MAVCLVTHRYVNLAITIPKFVVVIDVRNEQIFKVFLQNAKKIKPIWQLREI
jgi:hypothetical protein